MKDKTQYKMFILNELSNSENKESLKHILNALNKLNANDLSHLYNAIEENRMDANKESK